MVFVLLALCAGCAAISGVGMPAEDLTGLGAVVLERRNADLRTSGLVDGIVFFPPSDFRYVRRQDGDHVVVINAAGGKKPPVVDPGSEGAYRRMIAQNRLRRRQAGNGIVVYCPPGTWYVFYGRDGKGQVVLQVRDRLPEKEIAPFIKMSPGR